ncbi:S41 family peptidase [Patescibacteria group bacterium]|nr:S41 family peptidase [Patescibacteria group bacterium]
MNQKQKTSIIIGSIAIVLVAFFSGVYIGVENSGQLANVPLFSESNSGAPEGVNVSPLWKAWSVLNARYVPTSEADPVTEQDKLWGAIEGLAASFGDPYTVFLPPADSELFAEDISGNFEGVGMEIGIRNAIITIIAPLQGTPAKRAGVLSGDQIVKIDGKSTDRMTVDAAVKLIRGERGTTVKLTIAREGESELLDIPIVRDVIEIPTIDTQLRSDGIFVIELYNFSAIAPNLFRRALREFVELGGDKLIVDLRGNPGGFLEASVDIASWFLPTGKIIVTEDFGGSDKPRIHRSKGYDIFNDNLKLVILINQGSASASEIVAGALSEHGIATLVGDNTFGKGSVQELVKITSDTSLKVTIARWLTPDKNSISNGGLTPDVKVEITAEDIKEGKDPQLEKAVTLLLNM